MRKGIFAIITVGLFSTLISFFVFANEEDKEFEWTRVYGFIRPDGASTFFDKNRREQTLSEKGDIFGSAVLLTIYKDPKKEKIKEEEKVIRSAVTAVIMDCGTGLVMPFYDIYYDVEFPKIKDKGFAVKEYMPMTVLKIEKISPLYKAICPSFS